MCIFIKHVFFIEIVETLNCLRKKYFHILQNVIILFININRGELS